MWYVLHTQDWVLEVVVVVILVVVDLEEETVVLNVEVVGHILLLNAAHEQYFMAPLICTLQTRSQANP